MSDAEGSLAKASTSTRQYQGRWCYSYRGIDRNGHPADVRLSETRDLAAAKAFFRSARDGTGVVPNRVTSDGHSSYPGAIVSALGEHVTSRSRWLDAGSYIRGVFAS